MANEAPTAVGCYVLDDRRAGHLWTWLLRRHGLADETKFHSLPEVADATLGLHAARLPSPFATAVARSVSPAVALTLFDRNPRSGLMTVRCMRKTLHALPLELATVAHSATLHFRERDALRTIASVSVNIGHISRTIERIVDLLGRGEAVPPRTIEEQLVSCRTSVIDVRLALKLAWEQGVLAYQNDSPGWNREKRKFGLAAKLQPDFDRSMDSGKAAGQLMRTYFDRYGPASLRDATWWSGLSRSTVTTAMNESARSFVTVYAPWCQSPLYMYRDRYDQFHAETTLGKDHSPSLLAHEDVALKAYFESRKRYLGGLTPRRAFNQIGEVLPTVVHSGQVIGRWRWDVNRLAVTYSLFSGYSTPHLARDVSREAKKLSAALRLRWIAN